MATSPLPPSSSASLFPPKRPTSYWLVPTKVTRFESGMSPVKVATGIPAAIALSIDGLRLGSTAKTAMPAGFRAMAWSKAAIWAGTSYSAGPM